MTELLLCHAGWCALALGMDRHHEEALGHPGEAARLQRLRWTGWGLLTAALAHALALPAPTLPMSLVWWGVALSLGALATTALATWRPRWLPAAGAWALAAGLLAGAMSTAAAAVP